MADENQPQTNGSHRPTGIGLFWFAALLSATAVGTGTVTLPQGLPRSSSETPAVSTDDPARPSLFDAFPSFFANDGSVSAEAVAASAPDPAIDTAAATVAGRPLEAPEPSRGDPSVAPGPREPPPEINTVRSAPELSVVIDVRESVEVQQTATFRVKVENTTGTAARNVTVTCRFDDHFEFPGSRESVIRQPLGSLAPGEFRTLALSLAARRIGRGCLEVQVTSSAHADSSIERCVEIRDSNPVAHESVVLDPVAIIPIASGPTDGESIAVDIVGPRRRTVGSRAEYVVTVINDAGADLPAAGVTLSYDPALRLKEVSAGAERRTGVLRWDLGTLLEHERVQIQVEFECASIVNLAHVTASVTSSDRGVGEADSSLSVAARPDLEMRLCDMADPLETGRQSTFLLEVENHTSEPARDVVVHLVPSPNIEITGARVRHGSDALDLTAFVEGRSLSFQSAPPLEPGGRLSYEVEFKSAAAGAGELRALLQSPTLAVPLEVCEPIVMNPPLPGD